MKSIFTTDKCKEWYGSLLMMRVKLPIFRAEPKFELAFQSRFWMVSLSISNRISLKSHCINLISYCISTISNCISSISNCISWNLDIQVYFLNIQLYFLNSMVPQQQLIPSTNTILTLRIRDSCCSSSSYPRAYTLSNG